MPIDYDQTQRYLKELSQHNLPLLLRLEEEARRDSFPIIGPAAGKLCYLLTRAIGARKVF
jgi:predicted O-methyltransferase YrrM